MATHDIHTKTAYTSEQGRCRCGWVGPLRIFGWRAKRDANLHLRYSKQVAPNA